MRGIGDMWGLTCRLKAWQKLSTSCKAQMKKPIAWARTSTRRARSNPTDDEDRAREEPTGEQANREKERRADGGTFMAPESCFRRPTYHLPPTPPTLTSPRHNHR